MKLVRLALALGLGGSALILPGCGEGGAFFNQIETFVEHEGHSSNDMSSVLRSYAVNQKGTAAEIKSQLLASSRNEDRSRQELGDAIHRYTRREREQYPNLRTTSNTIVSETGEVAKREFPTED